MRKAEKQGNLFAEPNKKGTTPVLTNMHMQHDTRSQGVYRATLVGGAANMALLLFKLAAGVLGHSQAMIADAMHSLSDFATDIVVVVLVGLSSRPRDRSHGYGHGKYETLALTAIGIALLAVAVGIIVRGGAQIVAWAQGVALETPGKLALWAALASIALKEAAYRYTIARARRLGSKALEANAWHHRSDALSSVGTAAGIGGAIALGPRWAVLDPVASVVVGAFIAKVAANLLRSGLGDLLEQSLPHQVEAEIVELVAGLPGISDPHNLRTRRIGNSYAIELHIRIDGSISLRQAHDMASEVERLLRQRYGEGTHVAVHVEPAEEHSA